MMKRVIYRGILMLAAMFAVVVIGQAVQAADFPPSLPGLLVKMSSGDNQCAIFAGLKGGVKISCKSASGVIKTYDCAASGSNQVCKAPDTANVTVGRSDSYAAKCNKVCGPVSPGFK